MSHVKCQVSRVIFLFQSFGASRWRICYQRGLPHLVFYINWTEYLNICGCLIFTKWISKYICTPEMAWIGIQMRFEDHFIWILEYLCLPLIVVTFQKGSLMLPSKYIFTLDIYLMKKYDSNSHFSINIGRGAEPGLQ